MKNLKILPNQLVPKKIRLGVYKEALRIIINNESKYKLQSNGLCILLPCILWDLESYQHFAPCGVDWDFEETKNMFPELKDFLEKGTWGIYTDEERIEFLIESIENLSNAK